MVATSQRLMTPRDIARILFRQRKKMAIFFGSVVGLTLLVIALFPRSYTSESKLLLRVGRESVGLDPTATTGDTIMLQKTQADEIASAINILNSRAVLERVAEQVGPQRIVANLPNGSQSADGAPAAVGPVQRLTTFAGYCVGSVLQALRLSDPTSELELAVRKLQRGVSFWTPKESTVIAISYSAASPELAHDVVDAITNVFLDEHVRLGQSEGSLAFFSAQVDKLHDELTSAQTELRDRKNAFQLTAGSTDRLSIAEKTSEALRQKLYDLELQESELQSRYTAEYPPLKDVRRQQAEVSQALTEVSSSGAVAGKSGSPLLEDVTALNNQEFELAQLARSVELLEGKYRMHVEKLEQARVNDALGRDGISNVKVAQAATLVRKPESPKKGLLLAMGLLTAIVGSIGLAYLAEWFDQTLRTTSQVESELGLPVLLSLPERKRRKKRSAEATNGHAKVEHNGHRAPIQLPSQAYLSSYGALVREIMAGNENGESNGGRHGRMVGVIGCDGSKERSRVAVDLALQAAASGTDSVLLIDTDNRRRRVTKRFNINGSPGWREMLAGKAETESCVHRQEIGNLAVMSPGTPNGHVADSAAQPAPGVMGQLAGIKSDYGLVVVDLPPERDMETVPAAAEWLDEMVLVVEAEHTRIQSAQRAKDLLERAGVRVTGVVLANRREHIPRWLYQRL
jgi:uncharacterized protein involved in exopolysaccharide biosynthesis/Mrp family chromosome partitioning ATPase